MDASVLNTSKPRGLALALAILTLIGGVVAISTAGLALIGARLTSGRPGWLVLAAGLELLSAIGFVTIFQLAFGKWLPRRSSVRMALRYVAPRPCCRPAGCSPSASVPGRCAETACRT